MCSQDVPLSWAPQPLAPFAFPAPCDNQQHGLTLSHRWLVPLGDGVQGPCPLVRLGGHAQEGCDHPALFCKVAAQLGQTRPVEMMGWSWEASKLLVQVEDLTLIPTHAARGPTLMMKVGSLATSSCGAGSTLARPAAGPKKPHGRSPGGCDTPGMSTMTLPSVHPSGVTDGTRQNGQHLDCTAAARGPLGIG